MGEEAMKEDKFYYKDGTTSSEYNTSKVIHRIDGPACEYADGDKFWYIDSKLHRIDGPALEYTDGTKLWYIDGRRHRTDGPAAEYGSGTKAWYIDGKQHRIDGPAVEYPYGAKRWYVDGEHYTKEDFNQLIEEIRQLPKVLRLIYPREWVRNYEEK